MTIQLAPRCYVFFLIILPCLLTAQIELGEIEQVYNDACNGSIEIILPEEDSPHTIEFEGEGNDFLITPIDDDYTSYDLCAGEYSIIVTNTHGCVVDLGTVILHDCDPILISPEAVLYHPSACDVNDGEIRFFNPQVTGGTPPYTGILLDQNGEETDFGLYWDRMGDLSPGDYVLTISDAFDCEQEFFFTLNGEDEPNINFTIEPTCEGEENGIIFISAVSPDWEPILYDFEWSNGVITNNSNYSTIVDLVAGSYSVTITNPNNGCPVVENFLVPFVPNESLIVTTQSEISCPGQGIISASVLGGSGPYSFCRSEGGCITPAEDYTNFYFLNAGSYCITVTDVCGNTGVSCVEVLSLPEMEITSEITHDDVAPGGQGAIDLTVSGGGAPYSFYWSNFQNSEDISNLNSGGYTVTIVDANGCSKVMEFVLVSCGDENLFGTFDVWNMTQCDSESETPGEIVFAVIGGEAPYTYEWYKLATSDGPIVETYENNASSLTVFETGIYQVAVTDLCGNTLTYNQQIQCECDSYYTNFAFKAEQCMEDGANIEFAYEGSPWGGSECEEIMYVEWPDGSNSEIRINGFGDDLDYTVIGADSYEVTQEGQECITLRTGCGCEYEECWFFGGNRKYQLHYTQPISSILDVTANFPVYVGCGDCVTCGPENIPYTEDCALINETPFQYTPNSSNLNSPCSKGQIDCVLKGGASIEVPIGTQYTEYVDLNSNPIPAYEGGVLVGCYYDCHCLYPSDAFDEIYFDEPVLIETQILVYGSDACAEPPPPPPSNDECASGLFDYEYGDDCWVDKYCWDETTEDWVYLSSEFIGLECYHDSEPYDGICDLVVTCNINGSETEIVYPDVPCQTNPIECVPAIAGEGNSLNLKLNSETQGEESFVRGGETRRKNILQHDKVKIFPNPTGRLLNIEMNKPSRGRISVIDLVGEEVFIKKYNGKKVIIDFMNKLKTGIYYLKLEKNNGLVTYHKFVYIE